MQRLALFALLLAPSCAIPGDSAWSDLHANAYGGLYDLTAGGSIDDISGTSGALTASGDLEVSDKTETNFLYGARFGFAPVEVFLSGFEHDSTHGGTFTGSIGPINGTADDPAALIRLHDEEHNPTDTLVGHKFSTLRKEGERSFDREIPEADAGGAPASTSSELERLVDAVERLELINAHLEKRIAQLEGLSQGEEDTGIVARNEQPDLFDLYLEAF